MHSCVGQTDSFKTMQKYTDPFTSKKGTYSATKDHTAPYETIRNDTWQYGMIQDKR